MKLKNPALMIALVFPVMVLLVLTGYKTYKRFVGVEVIIPIAGYDPRDLLSGHYLTYRLDLGRDVCDTDEEGDTSVEVCIVQKNNVFAGARKIRGSNDEDCTAVLAGRCEKRVFLAGVERFYIPEGQSEHLDAALRKWGGGQHSTEILLSVGESGSALVKDLLIDGKSWKFFIRK